MGLGGLLYKNFILLRHDRSKFTGVRFHFDLYNETRILVSTMNYFDLL